MQQPFHIRGGPSLNDAAALLRIASLPTEDLRCDALEHFFLAEFNGRRCGLVGLELFGNEALLRSLTVSEGERGRGLGVAMVRHAETHAINLGVRSLFLLTTTAEAFFARLGYLRLDRAAAPPSIQGTREFSTLCPSNSAFMAKFF